MRRKSPKDSADDLDRFDTSRWRQPFHARRPISGRSLRFAVSVHPSLQSEIWARIGTPQTESRLRPPHTRKRIDDPAASPSRSPCRVRGPSSRLRARRAHPGPATHSTILSQPRRCECTTLRIFRATRQMLPIDALRQSRAGNVADGCAPCKAVLSSGCKPHPAIAPAGSNRSSHGGNEVAEAFD